jgi:hypothetical protein
MSLRLVAVTFPAEDPVGVGRFWAGMLGRDAIEEAGGVLVPGDDSQVGLRFVPGEPPASRRLHLHVGTATVEEQGGIIEDAIGRGARRRGRTVPPLGRDIYMSDPAGYDFCVIEPGAPFLAGCGPLAEVTCDGGREVGVFWRDALGWPLVWDREGQTAVQSPSGGTKISWDPWPESSAGGAADSSGLRFDLSASDAAAEVARLVGLGAAVLADRDGVTAMTDPGGGAFSVMERRSPPLS